MCFVSFDLCHVLRILHHVLRICIMCCVFCIMCWVSYAVCCVFCVMCCVFCVLCLVVRVLYRVWYGRVQVICESRAFYRRALGRARKKYRRRTLKVTDPCRALKLPATYRGERDGGDDFEGGASMRSRNGQIEISSNLFAQTPADILINNLVNAAQQQEGSPGTKESSTKRGAADETEGVLDAASSPRRQERETNREQAAQKQALVNAIARGADDFQGSLRELLQKALWRDREDEDEPGRRRLQRKIQEVDEDEMDE